MLRRSTSFDTRLMPTKIAMNRPNSDVAARPRSLMILTSWPAVSWPIRIEAPTSSTREQHEVVEHAVADRLAEDRDGDAPHRVHARRSSRAPSPICGDAADEHVLEGLAHRIERHERGARGDQLAQQLAPAAPSAGRSMA